MQKKFLFLLRLSITVETIEIVELQSTNYFLYLEELVEVIKCCLHACRTKVRHCATITSKYT